MGHEAQNARVKSPHGMAQQAAQMRLTPSVIAHCERGQLTVCVCEETVIDWHLQMVKQTD
jgi:hypothetical protein